MLLLLLVVSKNDVDFCATKGEKSIDGCGPDSNDLTGPTISSMGFSGRSIYFDTRQGQMPGLD